MKAYFLLFIPFFGSCSQKEEFVHPVRSDITESVYASGHIKAIDQYIVYPTVSGILREYTIQSGDSVFKGQRICLIENVISELQRENARLLRDFSHENSSESSDRIKELKLAADLAEEKYALDSSIYVRQKRLWEQNIGSQVDLEQKELSMKNARATHQMAQAKLEQLRLQLNNERDRADVGYRISDETTGDFAVKSAIDGKVFSTYRQIGELVTPQTPLATIGAWSSFLIELQIDENDIARVQLGQTLVLTMDSYPGQVFNAHLTRIYPIMEEKTRTFKVEALFEEAPGNLFPNLTVEANIVIQEKKNVLLIPREYLIDDQYVLLNKGEKHLVKIGLRDYRKVEILEGLDTLSTLYLP